MLDIKTDYVLQMLLADSIENNYSVFFFSEIAEAASGKELSKSDVISALKYLCERDFISVKYFDEDRACLKTLPKSKIYYESKSASEIIPFKKEYNKSIFVGLCAFCGAFIGFVFFAALILLLC